MGNIGTDEKRWVGWFRKRGKRWRKVCEGQEKGGVFQTLHNSKLGSGDYLVIKEGEKP